MMRFAYAPLLPVAATVTLGLLVDRYLSIPIPLSLAASLLCMLAWLACRRRRREQLALIYLWAACAGLAAAHHHAVRSLFPPDDIGHFAREEPALVKLRGRLAEEPTPRHYRHDDPLVSLPRADPTITIVEVQELEQGRDWRRASGRLQMRTEGKLDQLHVGDEIEVSGWLSKPGPPLNSGESSYADRLLDRRIRAELRVRGGPDAVVRIRESGSFSITGTLALVRGWGQQSLEKALPPSTSGIAAALLLGDGSAMTSEDWEKYIRTGVIHVLAISGQHLVILGGFLWVVCRGLGIRRRRSALFVAGVLLAYALLTGGRPSAMRAAVMVGVICLGILMRRPALPANTFALAWLIVLALNPTDLFSQGFQLSFLCVAVLIWGIPRWFPTRSPTPIEQLIDESRSPLERGIRMFVRAVGRWYLITLTLMICTTPLILSWQNVLSPVGVLIGPPAIVLTSIALIAGFLFLLLFPVASWLAAPFAWLTSQTINMCEWLVRWADRLPGSHCFLPAPPDWWLIGFHVLLIGALFGVRFQAVPVDFLPRWRPAIVAMSLSGWAVLGLLVGAWKPAKEELRVDFLAVGHGGCIILETPDGRVLMYDAGSLAGPDVTRRHIAPHLWSRGISRIDEVFVSHADLDHFNGLPSLADRFVIGQVTWTPSFAEKNDPGVQLVVNDLRRRGIAIRQAKFGDRFTRGDVSLNVLHPPAVGPGGAENARSLVLLVEHRQHRILLTGDLEKLGLEWFLDLPPAPVDVLMAPHHGSRAANTARLADWATPRLVVTCDAWSSSEKLDADVYQKRKIPSWITGKQGMITIHSRPNALIAETFKTKERLVLEDPR